jgi:hypothetical protein
MSTLAEIEDAIETLPPSDLEALAAWIENRRRARAVAMPVDQWLERARGTAAPGVTTRGVLEMTRGDE